MDGLNRNISDFDLIIKNGTLVDGTGNKPEFGDIALKDGLIAAVGKFQGKADKEIDAKSSHTMQQGANQSKTDLDI